MNQSIIRIVVADDHAGVRQEMVNMLNQRGDMQVTADVANGRQLLDILQQLNPLPDIAIVDIRMPEMDGYVATLEICKRYPLIRPIVFSIIKDDGAITRMIRNGAAGYLVKGEHSISDMCYAIRQIKEHGYYYDFVGRDLLAKAKQLNTPELTERELQFINLCSEGLTNKRIAEKMFVSHRTVEHYYNSLSEKFGVSGRVELVVLAIKRGIISLE